MLSFTSLLPSPTSTCAHGPHTCPPPAGPHHSMSDGKVATLRFYCCLLLLCFATGNLRRGFRSAYLALVVPSASLRWHLSVLLCARSYGVWKFGDRCTQAETPKVALSATAIFCQWSRSWRSRRYRVKRKTIAQSCRFDTKFSAELDSCLSSTSHGMALEGMFGRGWWRSACHVHMTVLVRTSNLIFSKYSLYAHLSDAGYVCLSNDSVTCIRVIRTFARGPVVRWARNDWILTFCSQITGISFVLSLDFGLPFNWD